MMYPVYKAKGCSFYLCWELQSCWFDILHISETPGFRLRPEAKEKETSFLVQIPEGFILYALI